LEVEPKNRELPRQRARKLQTKNRRYKPRTKYKDRNNESSTRQIAEKYKAKNESADKVSNFI
jgi:hypothetical protein